MEPVVTTRAALLLALRSGPGYGMELVRRAAVLSGGRFRLSPGSVYPALGALQRARLVTSWRLIPGGRRGGRSRTYYDLTWRGVEAADRDRQALTGLVRPPQRGAELAPADIAKMRARLRRAAEVSEFLLDARRRRRPPIRRRP